MLNNVMPNAQSAVICEMLEKLGISVAALADEMHYARSTVYRWLSGDIPCDFGSIKAAIKHIMEMRNAALREFEEAVKKAPTVDAVPVVHGRWRFRKNWDFFVCSECSYESSNYSNYCPNCGAKMDGGVDDG